MVQTSNKYVFPSGQQINSWSTPVDYLRLSKDHEYREAYRSKLQYLKRRIEKDMKDLSIIDNTKEKVISELIEKQKRTTRGIRRYF